MDWKILLARVQKPYCYTPGICVGVYMENVRANVKVLKFQPLFTKAYDSLTSSDCGTSALLNMIYQFIFIERYDKMIDCF